MGPCRLTRVEGQRHTEQDEGRASDTRLAGRTACVCHAVHVHRSGSPGRTAQCVTLPPPRPCAGSGRSSRSALGPLAHCRLCPENKQNSSAPGRRSRGTGRNRRAAGGGGARENPCRCGRSAVSGVGTKRGGGAGGGRSLPSPPSTPGRPWPGCMSVWSGGLPRSYTEPEELVAASPSPAGGHRVLARALDHRLSACRGHTGGLPSPAVPQAESRGKPPVTSASLCLPLPLCLRRP